MSQVTYYWHNGRSLGHTFESRKFITALMRAEPDVRVSAATGAFRGLHLLPDECDVLRLPGFRNFDTPDGYRVESRLRLSYAELLDLRRALLTEYLRRLRPDVLVVNHELRGYEGELVPALTEGRRDGTRVLALRGVLDAAAPTRDEYFTGANEAFLLDSYDLLQVHIDPAVFDLADYYGLSHEVAGRIRYVGYPDDPFVLDATEARTRLGVSGDGPLVVAAMGGGQGAGDIWTHLMKAIESVPEIGTVVAFPGPYLEPAAAELVSYAAERDPRVRILPMADDLRPYLAAADLFIGAAGASTTSEVLACRSNAILVARQLQEREQEIHSELLARRGLVRSLRLADWVEDRIATTIRDALAAPLPDAPPPLLGGTRAGAALVGGLLRGTTELTS